MGLTIIGENETEEAKASWSYTTFSWFRHKLCLLVNDIDLETFIECGKTLENEPFFELLYHNDNSGEFATEQCKALHEDFEQYREQLEHEDSYFLEIYEDIALCFGVGSNNGTVEFL